MKRKKTKCRQCGRKIFRYQVRTNAICEECKWNNLEAGRIRRRRRERQPIPFPDNARPRPEADYARYPQTLKQFLYYNSEGELGLTEAGKRRAQLIGFVI